MATADFVHEIEIGIAPDRLHAFLCDLSNYRALHPLIESIEELPTCDETPGARRYRVVDRVPVGPFRLRTTYLAALQPVGESEVYGRAWQSPGIRIDTLYRLEAVAGGTRLVETASVEAPRLLRRFVVHQARQAHGATLGKMKAFLEDGEGDRAGSQ